MELDSRVLTALTDVIARLDTEEFFWILRDVADARAAVDLQSELLGRLQRKASRGLASDGQLRGACIDRQLVVAVLLSFPGEVPAAMYGKTHKRIEWAIQLMRQIGGEPEVHSHYVHRLDLAAHARAAERLQQLRIGGRWLLIIDRGSGEARVWYVPLIGGVGMNSGPLQQTSPFGFRV